MAQLASLLAQPFERVQIAVSVAIRLGFARKVTAPSLKSPRKAAVALGGLRPLSSSSLAEWHASWFKVANATAVSAAVAPARAIAATAAAREAAALGSADPNSERGDNEADGPLRHGLLVDSKLAAILMMSNLLGNAVTDLKQHAVTLYEVRADPPFGNDVQD